MNFNIIRKVASLFIIFSLIVGGVRVSSLIITVYAQENEQNTLEKVVNMEWKEGSTATATWSPVEGANYYIVNVYVYYNGLQIGTRETGTAAYEIDLQQEINVISGYTGYNTVQVSFDVTPKKIDTVNNTNILGEVSDKSGLIDYLNSAVEKIKLMTPSNLTIRESDNRITWSGDSNADMYYIQFKFNDSGVESFYTTYVRDYSGRNTDTLSAYITEELKRGYVSSFSENKTVKVSYKLYGTFWTTNDKENYYTPSDWSNWSSEINYTGLVNEKVKFATPTNLTFNEVNQQITWHGDSNADMYYIQFKFNDGGVESFYTTYVRDYSGRNTDTLSAYITEELKRGFIGNYSENKRLRVSYKLYGTYWTTNDKENYFISSDWSDWSSEIVYDGKIDEKVKFATPTNLTIDPQNLRITWHGDKNVDMYYIQFRFLYGGIDTSYTTYVRDYSGRNTDTLSATIQEEISRGYQSYGIEPAPVYLSYRLYGTYWTTNNKELYFKPSDWSNWSEEILYNPNNLALVDKIELSPDVPIVSVGGSIYLGKTIYPTNAYYKGISWESKNNNVASIDSMGKITGNSEGNTTVTAKIGKAESHATVNVYKIESNINDYNDKKEVTDTAGSIIDDIANGEDLSLDNTDISEEDLDGLQKEIQEAVVGGDSFHTDIKAIQERFDTYKSNWGQIQKAADELNAEFAGAYNIEVEMYHKDDNNIKHHIGNITELDNEISFTFNLPTGMKEQLSDNSNKYVLVRVHKNENGINEYTPINFKISENGTFTAKSDKYSDFVWLSVKQESNKKENIKEIPKIKTVELSKTKYTYDGKAKKPSVIVKDSTGKKIASSNYKVEYSKGRKNVGKYKVKVTLKGNYSGTKNLSFTIIPKGTNISNLNGIKKGFKIKWKKQKVQTTGYQIRYSTNKSMKSASKPIVIKKNTVLSKKVSKLKAKKKYYIQIRTYKKAGKDTIYSNWSKVKAVTTKNNY